MTQTVLSKFRRIGITAEKPSRETATIIFMLQHLTDPRCNGSKSKINVYSKKEMESPDFARKLANPELRTVKITSNKTGWNYNSIDDVRKDISENNKVVADVLLAEIEQTNAAGMWKHVLGETIGDLLVGLGERTKGDIIFNQAEFTKILLPRLALIHDSINDFDEKSIKETLTGSRNLIFVTVKSENKNNIIGHIAMAEGADILFHRRDTEGGNFISFSEKAASFRPEIVEALNREEKKRNPNSAFDLWHTDFNVIHTSIGFISAMKFAEIEALIKNTVSEAADLSTNHHIPMMNPVIQTDSALAMASC